MQAAKDSFTVELRKRLAALAPARTASVNGVVQPAILVTENSSVTPREMAANCFWLGFGAAQAARGWEAQSPALMTMECTVAYRTQTSLDGSGRGRALAELDGELLAIWSPGTTAKLDYTHTPASELGSNVFWLRPKLGEVADESGTMRREAKLELFFYAEEGA